jgi:hypothetical protein
VTVELRDVSLGEAVEKTLHPFGMTGVKVETPGKARAVTLSLREGSLWEAVDGLEKAAGIRLDLQSGEISDRQEPEVRPSGTGDVRIGTGGSWAGHSGPGGSESVLRLSAWLPPGAWACSAELEDVELTAEGGGKILSRLMPQLEGERRRGLPTQMEVGGVAVRPENLKGVKKASVRGTLRMGFPRDIERLVKPLVPLPSEVALLGGTVKLTTLGRSEDGDWKLELESSGGSEPFTVLLSVEDAAGAWLGDLRTLNPRPGTSFYMTGGWEPSVEGKPARWVIVRSVGEVSVKIPFSLSSIDVPRSVKD